MSGLPSVGTTTEADRLARVVLSVGVEPGDITTSRLVRESRFPVGSSAIKIAGSFTSARAMATRCCCPPESCPGW